MTNGKIISWFSAGVSSAVATYLALKQFPNLEIIYIDIDNQHIDSARFVSDCEKFFNREIKVLKSPYKSVENVIKSQRYINGPYGAKCTQLLKKRVRQEWEMINKPDGYIWGMDCSRREITRAERINETMKGFKHYFPLIDSKITKENAHAIVKSWGVKRPQMYDLGYPNNNCIGCVKGGMGYWNKIKKDFPNVFERMAGLEREIGRSCVKGTFLDELKETQGRDLKVIVPDCGMFCDKEDG